MNRALIFFFSLLVTVPAARADGFLAGYAGKASASTSSSISPISYGGGLGIKKGALGASFLYVTGSKSTTISGADVTSTVTEATGRLDLYPLRSKFISIGPEISSVSIKVGATLGAASAEVKLSGVMYGVGSAINLPLGRLSFGVDAGYLTGTLNGVSGHISSVLGSLKIWL